MAEPRNEPIRERARQLRTAGHSVPRIATELGVSRGRVWQYLEQGFSTIRITVPTDLAEKLRAGFDRLNQPALSYNEYLTAWLRVLADQQ